MPRLLLLPTLLLAALSAMAQEPGPAKYRMELLSMIRSDSTRGCNDVQASILVTPIKAKDCPRLRAFAPRGLAIDHPALHIILPLNREVASAINSQAQPPHLLPPDA